MPRKTSIKFSKKIIIIPLACLVLAGFLLAGHILTGSDKVWGKVLGYNNLVESNKDNSALGFDKDEDRSENPGKLNEQTKGEKEERFKIAANGNYPAINFGPSIYLNKEYSSINLGGDTEAVAIAPRYNQGIVRTDFSPERPVWEKENNKIIDSPSSRSYPVDFEKKDEYFYIVDKGERQIRRRNININEVTKLGMSEWKWEPNGITVVEDGNFYITDSLEDRIIETSIDGTVWRDSKSIKDKYFTKLFLTGEEEFYYQGDSDNISEAYFYADGYNKHKVRALPRVDGNNLTFNNSSGEFEFVDKRRDNRVFGDASLNFNGERKLVIPHHYDWKFRKDSFLVDFWVKFNSFQGTTSTFFAKPYSYEFNIERQSIENGVGSFILTFNSIHENEGGAQEEGVESTFRANWETEDPFGWHNIKLVVDNKKSQRVNIYIDEEELSGNNLGVNSYEPIQDYGKDLIIGANRHDENYLRANIDNFKLVRAHRKVIEYFDNAPPLQRNSGYYFDDPAGITKAGDYLYVADSDQDRIVKIHENFNNIWDTFGNSGGCRYCFDNPTDIVYKQLPSESRGYFYIIDSGNKRIIKTDMAVTSNRFKNSDFSEASWEEMELKDFYEEMDSGWGNDAKFKSPQIYSRYFDYYRSSDWTKDLSNYLKNTPYENGVLKISIKGQGAFDVSLKDSMDGDESFNLEHSLSMSGVGTLTFGLPPDFVLDRGDGLFLDISAGGQIKFVKVILSKQFDPSGLYIDDEANMYLTDKKNGSVVRCNNGAESMSCRNVWIQGKQNPKEEESNSLDTLDDHSYVFQTVSPRDIYVEPGNNPDYFILEGLSDSDLVITSGREN